MVPPRERKKGRLLLFTEFNAAVAALKLLQDKAAELLNVLGAAPCTVIRRRRGRRGGSWDMVMVSFLLRGE